MINYIFLNKLVLLHRSIGLSVKGYRGLGPISQQIHNDLR
jgi:hypothetical protein